MGLGGTKWGDGAVWVQESKREGRGRMVSEVSLIFVSERIMFFEYSRRGQNTSFFKGKEQKYELAPGTQHYFAMLIGHGSKLNVLIWMLELKEYHFQKFLGSHSMGFMFIFFPLDSWVSSIKYTDTSKQE